MRRGKLHYAWIILAAVILIRGFAGGGLNMTSGLFLAPVAGDLGVGIGSLSIYLSIVSVVMVLWLPAAGKLLNRFDARVMALAGAALQALAFAGFGWMDSVTGFYLLAAPYAMGSTIIVNLLGPILINRWFARRAGTMMGIQMAFVGLFGAVLQPFASSLILERGWRNTYRILGGLTFLIVFLVTLVLLRDRPEQKHLSAYGADGGRGRGRREEDKVQIPEKTAVRSASFYLLLLFMISITGVGIFTQHIPTYGSLLGYDLQQVGLALSLASVGNAAGSVAIGMVSDRIGSLKTCYGMIGVGMAAVAGFLFGGRGFGLFGAAAFLHGLTSAGIMVLAPILTIKFYGRQDYEKIYAKVSMGAPLASILLLPAYGYIYDWTKSYRAVLWGMLGLLFLAWFGIALGWKKRCTRDGCPTWRR